METNRQLLRASAQEPVLDMSLSAMLGAVIAVFSGIGMLITGFMTFRIRPTRSSEYAGRQLERLIPIMDEETRRRSNMLADQYYIRYIKKTEQVLFLYIFLLLGFFIVIIIAGGGSTVSFLAVAAAGAAAMALTIWKKQRIFLEFAKIITQECQPYAAVLAFLKPFGTRQRFRINKWDFNYLTIITLGFYYMGEFQTAFHHLGIVWDENIRLMKISVTQIHFRTLRLYCMREMELWEKAEAEKAKIEECLNRHPIWEKHIYAARYRSQENINTFLEEGRFEKARQLLLERADVGQPLYIQVSAHYQLWLAARRVNDPEEAGIHAEFITQYGKDMFYYARINREQQ